ncbi:hypothetical protein [Paraburkholderia sp. BL21I4N1]|uniref:hypothetical protein n=1 Tax=Paraburkholderia sp. BL21I4N1 TaxID=1938801 RepID=UPI000CFD49DC|nr:hypothetical protein [Paraburkholderia sp. BL21I4N1]PQV52790.1 hypothetical protein B0G83_103543 [Paraburkholderia sp. BL21I4N1]
MKFAPLMIAFGLACAAAVPASASATDAKYPPAPLPAYAQDELQRVVNAATGAPAVLSAPQGEANAPARPAGLQNDSYVAPRDETHTAASANLGKREGRASKPRRHEKHKYV